MSPRSPGYDTYTGRWCECDHREEDHFDYGEGPTCGPCSNADAEWARLGIQNPLIGPHRFTPKEASA